MDFVDGLPTSPGKSVIFVIVDRFSKYAHFIPLKQPDSAMSVAQVFFDNINKFPGMHCVIEIWLSVVNLASLSKK